MEIKTKENLNKIGEQEQIQIVLARAKEYGWPIYRSEEKNNFHIWIGKNLLQKVEYKNYKGDKISYWSLFITKENKRINGDYGTIITEMINHYEE